MQRKKLKIDKYLPKIKLPAKKMRLFADWWNEDIRFEKTIPHSFEEGYFIVENEHSQTTDNYKDFIKLIAKKLHTTYKIIEVRLQEFLDLIKNVTLYFRFIKENKMYIEVYDAENLILSRITFEFGNNDKPEPPIELCDTSFYENNVFNNMDELISGFNLQFIYYLSTCLWYMATAGTNTRYIYEEKTPIITGRKKNVVQISNTKYIRTPVYDMSKVKTVKVERLITRKKGWTYSHSFQVHGHYRHYKDGKVIFIESYIKGKGKPFKAQTTILEPERIKEV